MRILKSALMWNKKWCQYCLHFFRVFSWGQYIYFLVPYLTICGGLIPPFPTIFYCFYLKIFSEKSLKISLKNSSKFCLKNPRNFPQNSLKISLKNSSKFCLKNPWKFCLKIPRNFTRKILENLEFENLKNREKSLKNLIGKNLKKRRKKASEIRGGKIWKCWDFRGHPIQSIMLHLWCNHH